MSGLGAAQRLLDVRTISLEPAVGDQARGCDVFDRFPHGLVRYLITLVGERLRYCEVRDAS